jgi:hypothetical protein
VSNLGAEGSNKVDLQFRAEGFNVWNNANFRSPNMTASSRDFGPISDARHPRLIQFALKLTF